MSPAPAATMAQIIARFDDEELERELSFAEGFDIPGEDARAWLDALRAEKAKRA